DAVIEEGPWLHPVEIKSGSTATSDMARSLRRWPEIAAETAGRGTLVYGGDVEQRRSDYDLRPWYDPLPDVLRSR
ncbi:MAG: AAA family ATPase, partial [Spirochaetes bacterium]|nr:AAA family ATPase [Spirochaetota bacterium]